MQDSLEVSFSRSAQKALGAIKTETEIEKIAEGLTPIVILWPDIALIEASRQIGHIGSIFGLTAEDLDQTVTKMSKFLNSWQQEVRTRTLEEVNKILGIFGE